MSLAAASFTEKIGFALTRVIVPLWVLAGAGLKFYYLTPKNLPKGLFDPFVRDWGVAPGMLLATILGLEFFAIAVMVFLGRWARAMAIFMLACFLLVLFNEMRLGQFESCGCFGNITVSPWITFSVDLALLAGVAFFKPARVGVKGNWPVPATVVATLLGFGLSFGMLWNYGDATPASGNGGDPPVAVGSGNGDVPAPPENGGPADPGTDEGGDPTPPQPVDDGTSYFVQRTPAELPGYLIIEPDTWIGERFENLEIAKLMPEWPRNLNEGKQYILFFAHTCDHCHDLIDFYFTGPLPAQTTAVAIPESKTGFQDEGKLPFICDECQLTELPIGCDYFITTPLLVAIEDGVVQCATEGEDPEEPACILWH